MQATRAEEGGYARFGPHPANVPSPASTMPRLMLASPCHLKATSMTSCPSVSRSVKMVSILNGDSPKVSFSKPMYLMKDGL